MFFTQNERFPSTPLKRVEQSLRHSASWGHFPAQRSSLRFIIVRGWPSLLNNVRETHTLEMIPKSMILKMLMVTLYLYDIADARVCCSFWDIGNMRESVVTSQIKKPAQNNYLVYRGRQSFINYLPIFLKKYLASRTIQKKKSFAGSNYLK